jgi:hypothetical protein
MTPWAVGVQPWRGSLNAPGHPVNGVCKTIGYRAGAVPLPGPVAYGTRYSQGPSTFHAVLGSVYTTACDTIAGPFMSIM